MSKSSTSSISRRHFVGSTAASAIAFNFIPKSVWGANDRIRVGGIGVGGKGKSDVAHIAEAGGTIAALCDVDQKRGEPSFKAFPNAARYEDFRLMLEKEKLDAVTVSTPDHTHAVAAAMAIKMGIHVYVQKPLTHSIYEARYLTELAREHHVTTQMGNQAHAGEPIRRGVELLRAGIIGPVTQVHAWTNRPVWPQGMKKWPAKADIPKHLNWDLWLGPAPERDYGNNIAPFKWRGYWEYGTGAIGDIACHAMDLGYWALDLGAPISISAESGGMSEISPPLWSDITYKFPARSRVGGAISGAGVGPIATIDMPEVTFTWYDGKKDGKENAPYHLLKGENHKSWDCIFIGRDGVMFFKRQQKKNKKTGKMNAWIKVDHEKRLKDFEASTPKTIARVENEDVEFIHDIKGKGKALSNFEYAGPFTEMALLGNLAIRTGKQIQWDSKNLKCINVPEANQYIKRDYREGWTL